MKTSKSTVVFIGVVFFLGMFVQPVFAVKGPIEMMKPVLTKLTGLLNDPNLQGDVHRDERRQKIMETIKSGFDFHEMCKRVLGRTWRDIDDEQREHFTKSMTKFLENAYIGKLEDYHYKKIEYVGETIRDDRAVVTTMVEKGNVKLPVRYVLQLTPQGWMVYDINIEGLTLVKNYREQFRSILLKDSFTGLLKIIEDKNKSMEKNGKGS